MSLLNRLPAISFCETDTEEVEAAVIREYEGISKRKLYPGDPVRLFLLSLAKIINMQRVIIDTTAKQNLLAFSSHEKLDHLGALTGTERLQPRPARTVLRFFSADSYRGQDIWVDAGTLVAADSQVIFATDEDLVIPKGKAFADVDGTCEVPGEIGNGWLPGQINQLVPDLSRDGILGAENIVTSEAGADVEEDDRFRERIWLSVERYSTAGTRGGYEYWTKTAHQHIADVAVTSPEPGIVDVYVLMKDSRLPDADMIEHIHQVLDADDVRPLTDTCCVKPPEYADIAVDVVWYIAPENSAMTSTVARQVEKAVAEWAAWQQEKLGRDINPSELIHRIQEAGAWRVDVKSPAWKALKLSQVARITDVQVRFGGIES